MVHVFLYPRATRPIPPSLRFFFMICFHSHQVFFFFVLISLSFRLSPPKPFLYLSRSFYDAQTGATRSHRMTRDNLEWHRLTRYDAGMTG